MHKRLTYNLSFLFFTSKEKKKNDWNERVRKSFSYENNLFRKVCICNQIVGKNLDSIQQSVKWEKKKLQILSPFHVWMLIPVTHISWNVELWNKLHNNPWNVIESCSFGDPSGTPDKIETIQRNNDTLKSRNDLNFNLNFPFDYPKKYYWIVILWCDTQDHWRGVDHNRAVLCAVGQKRRKKVCTDPKGCDPVPCGPR